VEEKEGREKYIKSYSNHILLDLRSSLIIVINLKTIGKRRSETKNINGF
jgi:hypothetical protein